MSNQPHDKAPDALLGDLESIRTLLVDDDEQNDASEVPLLDDIVDEQDAQPLPPPPSNDRRNDDSPVGLDDNQIQALLGNDWKSTASEALTSARKTIESHSNNWSPEDTDELNEALRVRIDDTIFQWTQKMMREHIDELRAEVLKVFSDDLKRLINEQLKGDDGS